MPLLLGAPTGSMQAAPCGMLHALLEHLRQEEAEFLAPEVLRDDIVAIDLSDG